jgi:hypothetical protein
MVLKKMAVVSLPAMMLEEVQARRALLKRLLSVKNNADTRTVVCEWRSGETEKE